MRNKKLEIKDNYLTFHPHDMKLCRITKKKCKTYAVYTTTSMIVSMHMMTSTYSYTKSNKIKLYLHYKTTQERRFEFGAVEENSKFCSIWSLDHPQVESESSHDLRQLLFYKILQDDVPICSLVLPHVRSNSSHDPRTLQSWLFYCNNTITTKAILTS